MCVYSLVHDHFEPQIPEIEPEVFPVVPSPYVPPKTYTLPLPPVLDLKDLQRLIEEFRQLLDAAKTIDEKTNQPDCADPEKVKLQDRIKELEKIIASPPEFVLVQGGRIEPGRYRVIDGKLYKAVE